MKMKKTVGIIIGVLLIAAGVMYALDVFGFMKISISLAGWWTVFIIVPSLYGLATSKEKVGNLIAFLIGVYLLLAAQKVIDYDMLWKLFVPTVIVLVGVRVIVHTISGTDAVQSRPKSADNKQIECMAAFNSKTEDYSDAELKVAKIGAVFGGAKCNLSDTHFESESQIDVFCMFGGAEIIVPENVDVKINAFCMFGGISDKRNNKSNVEKTNVLTVNGFCMFGGADIK